MMFGLTDNALELMRGVFAQHPELDRVVIYGSRALGRERPNSDIDLALFGRINGPALGQIAAELDELPLPFLFDVANYAEITHAPLREHIDRHGQVLYPKNGG